MGKDSHPDPATVGYIVLLTLVIIFSFVMIPVTIADVIYFFRIKESPSASVSEGMAKLMGFVYIALVLVYTAWFVLTIVFLAKTATTHDEFVKKASITYENSKGKLSAAGLVAPSKQEHKKEAKECLSSHINDSTGAGLVLCMDDKKIPQQSEYYQTALEKYANSHQKAKQISSAAKK